MAWLKSLHIAFLLTWCAGLFYLPGVFACHRHARDRSAMLRLNVMSRMVFVWIASPAAVLAIVTGTALVVMTDAPTGPWLPLKLTAVAGMVFFHLYCGHIVERLDTSPSLRGLRLRLLLLVAPGVLVPLVFWLVMAKPTLGLPA